MLDYICTDDSNATGPQIVGFLRATFENDVSFAAYPLRTLLVFDKKFKSYFPQLHQYIQRSYNHMKLTITTFPETCLLMSLPMIKAIKNGASNIHHLVADYYQFVIDILLYTFDDNQEAFDKLLNLLKYATNVHWERLWHTEY
jgi:hypothetical protein